MSSGRRSPACTWRASARAASTDHGARRLPALAVPRDPVQATLGRPPAVAVHDDGHVLRQGERFDAGQELRVLEGREVGHGHVRQSAHSHLPVSYQKVRISCSFFLRSSSTRWMNLSVIFWVWSWPRRPSSSEIFFSFSIVLSFLLAS